MKTVELGSLCADNLESVDPRRFPNEEFELWSIPSFDVGKPEIRRGAEIGSAKKTVRPNDVLLSRIVPHIRRSWVVSTGTGRRQVASGEWIVFRSEDIVPSYLRHFLTSDIFHAPFMRTVAGVGGSLLRARPDGVAKIKVRLPSIEEQQRIAKILDLAEDICRKRRQAFERIGDLYEATFLDMFGDPIEKNSRWPRTKIGSLIFDVRGGANLEPTDFVDFGFPVLHKGAIKRGGTVSTDAKKKVFASQAFSDAHARNKADGTYVAVTLRDLVPAGPTIGLAADLSSAQFGEYLLAQGVYAFRLDLDRVAEQYFVWLSNMPTFRPIFKRNAVGSTQIHIRTPVYKNIEIPLPPIELQRAFAARATGIDELRIALKHSLDKCEELSATLRRQLLAPSLEPRDSISKASGGA